MATGKSCIVSLLKHRNKKIVWSVASAPEIYTLRRNSSPHCISSSQLSVDIQLNGLIQCREDSGVQMKLTHMIFRSLSSILPESAALRQWTPVIYNWINWNTSWFHWPRTSHKLQFNQLAYQHGTTWAVTSRAQWADCFWERNDRVFVLMTDMLAVTVV